MAITEFPITTKVFDASDVPDLSTVYETVDATIVRQADVDDTPVNGVTTAPVSSNWAYDHANSAAAHAAANISVDASGFNGILAGTDDTVQKVAQKVDDLVASGGMTDLVSDTTPQLGGNLDINGFQITGSGGTVTTSQPVLNVTQTWNASGVAFKGIVLNVTNTASAAGSNLLELQVGGVVKNRIDKDGNAYTAGLSLGGAAVGGGGDITTVSSSKLVIGTGHYIFASDGTGLAVTSTTTKPIILQSANGYVEQRSGTVKQGKLVYNTYTDASNYERGIFDWNATSNVLTLGTQAAGTGTLRKIQLVGAGILTDGTILPTTNPAVAGQLWNDGGTVKVSTG